MSTLILISFSNGKCDSLLFSLHFRILHVASRTSCSVGDLSCSYPQLVLKSAVPNLFAFHLGLLNVLREVRFPNQEHGMSSLLFSSVS